MEVLLLSLVVRHSDLKIPIAINIFNSCKVIQKHAAEFRLDVPGQTNTFLVRKENLTLVILSWQTWYRIYESARFLLNMQKRTSDAGYRLNIVTLTNALIGFNHLDIAHNIFTLRNIDIHLLRRGFEWNGTIAAIEKFAPGDQEFKEFLSFEAYLRVPIFSCELLGYFDTWPRIKERDSIPRFLAKIFDVQSVLALKWIVGKMSLPGVSWSFHNAAAMPFNKMYKTIAWKFYERSEIEDLVRQAHRWGHPLAIKTAQKLLNPFIERPQ